jgi:YesN/AraC family two-component response regulator
MLPLIIISLVLNSVLNSFVQKQQIEINTMLLKSISSQIDINMAYTINSSYYIGYNKAFLRLMADTADNDYERQEQVREISGYLRDVTGTSGMYQSALVYLPERDLVITTGGATYSFAKYFSDVLCLNNYTAKEFADAINGVTRAVFLPLLTSENVAGRVDYVCLVRSIPSDYKYKPAYIITFYNAAKLCSIIQNNISSNSYYSVYTPEGVLLTGNADNQLTSLTDLSSFDQTEASFNGVDYLRFYERLKNSSLQLVYYLPKAQVLQRLIYYQKILYLVIGFLLLISISISALLSARHYLPLKKLYEQVFPNDMPTGREYEKISQKLEDVRQQNDSFIEEIQHQYKILLNNTLIQLLTVQDTILSDEQKSLMTENNLYFPNPRFFVVLIHNCEKEKLILPNTTLCTLPNTYYALIINDSEENNQIDMVLERLHQLQTQNPTMILSCSTAGSSLQDLYRCFYEASDRFIEQTNSASQSEDSEDSLSTIFYPIDREIQLINALNNGDYEKCVIILTELQQINEHKRHLTTQMMQCLYHNMIVTVCRVYNSMQFSEKEPLRLIARSISSDIRDRSIFNYILEIYRSVSYLCMDNLKTKNERIIGGVLQYINDHHTDADLSLNSVSDAFNVSYYYLSHIFHNEASESFTDVLNKIRIKHACHLLADTTMTAQDIALAVGYTNATSFFRIFRKLTNNTPQQYRKIVQNNQKIATVNVHT